MARVPRVTRTIQTTKVNALCVDVEEQKTFEGEYILSGTYKDEKHLFKALEKVANDEIHRVAHILHSEVIETLYGMSEQDFIKYAKPLPPRGVKADKDTVKTTAKK